MEKSHKDIDGKFYSYITKDMGVTYMEVYDVLDEIIGEIENSWMQAPAV